MSPARELRVVDDLPAAAAELFVRTVPKTIALSGGSTPRPVYEQLAQVDYPWAQVDVFFGDERCVPPDDPDSNFRMAHESLLQYVDATDHRMSACDPDAYERELESVFGVGPSGDEPRFDLVFLGLGEDGHTCSLFPGNPVLDVTDRRVALVQRPDHQRMTLTYPVLNAAKLAVFLVSGEGKREPLQWLMNDADVPAAKIASERIIVLADAAAAG